GTDRERALVELHELLLGAARFAPLPTDIAARTRGVRRRRPPAEDARWDTVSDEAGPDRRFEQARKRLRDELAAAGLGAPSNGSVLLPRAGGDRRGEGDGRRKSAPAARPAQPRTR